MSEAKFKSLYCSTLISEEVDGVESFVSIGPYELEPPKDSYYEDTVAEVWQSREVNAVSYARLFAAAPDLYEACKDAQIEMKWLYEQTNARIGGSVDRAYRKLVAALAKVEAQQ